MPFVRNVLRSENDFFGPGAGAPDEDTARGVGYALTLEIVVDGDGIGVGLVGDDAVDTHGALYGKHGHACGTDFARDG